MFFSIKKKRIIYGLAAIIPIIILVGIFFTYSIFFTNKPNPEVQETNNEVEIVLQFETQYVVGEDSLEIITESIESIDEIINRYPDWEVKEVSENKVILSRNVEDISPDCKKGTYFGLDSEGYLTLFSGSPKNKTEQNPIIETFFRIDIEKLESALPSEPVQQLYEGIPIQDLAEFNSVLSTFSEYSID